MKRVIDAVVMALSFVVEPLHLALSLAAAPLTIPLELLTAVPGLRLVRQAWNIVLEIVWRLAGLPDLLLGALGVRPEKKLRLRVVIQRDEQGVPIATESRALQEVRAAVDVFMDAANIRVLPLRWIAFSTPFSSRESADARFLHTAAMSAGTSRLDVEAGLKSWLGDLGTEGSDRTLGLGFWGALRRLLGYGTPLTAYIVRTMNGALGVSLGPLTDYVTITLAPGDDTTLFHELGHSCGLLDGGQAGTLMSCPGACGRGMSKLQALIARNSRHVTYF